jgi:threonine/homoserine/homoserine lactone efflux protein
MNQLKNTALGFLISIVGSIPVGYLNIIGFQIFTDFGKRQWLEFAIGVVAVEFVIIIITYWFLSRFARFEKSKIYLQIASIVFLLLLTILSFFGNESQSINALVIKDNFFSNGFVFSCLNFLQWPFWIGWNTYFVSKTESRFSFFWLLLFGVLCCLGTVLGMFAFAIGLEKTISLAGFSLTSLFKNFWILFLVLAGYQIVQLLLKIKKK